MLRKDFWKMAALACCLAFALVLAGCDNPTRGNGNGVVNGNGNDNNNNDNNNVHTPIWSGPHRITAFDAIDWFPNIVFGNGRFFAFGEWDDGHDWGFMVKTSTNGTTWTDVTNTVFDDFHWVEGITFGGGRFFAFGEWYDENDWGFVKTSTNGTTWNDVTDDFSDYFTEIYRIVYSGGRFFAFGRYDDGHDWNRVVMTSTNGTTWAKATDLDAFDWVQDIVFGNGRFFAFGEWDDGYDWGPMVKTSTNGTTWEEETNLLNNFNNLFGISFGGGRFFAVGSWEDGNDFGPLVKTSTNGTLWTDVTSNIADPDTSFIEYITFPGGRFYAFGIQGIEDWVNPNFEDMSVLVKSSTDGTNWVEETFLANNIQMGEGLHVLGVFYGGGRTFIFTFEVDESWDNMESFVLIKE